LHLKSVEIKPESFRKHTLHSISYTEDIQFKRTDELGTEN